MRLLSILCFLVFVITFLHVSVVVGYLFQIPLAGDVFLMQIERNEELLVKVPFTVYAFVGVELWRSDLIEGLLREVYAPIFGELDRVRDPRTRETIGRALIDLGRLNWIVLGSLAASVVLAAGGRLRRSRRRAARTTSRAVES